MKYGNLSNAIKEIQDLVYKPLGYVVDLPKTPYPGIKTTLRELQYLKQVQRTNIDPEFLEQCDEDFMGLFMWLLQDLGVMDQDRQELDDLEKQFNPLILKLKYYYNRARPYQYAQKYGIPVTSEDFETAQTPGYPSGHTLQAHYTGLHLSHKYPQHREEIMDLAERISFSRIQAGVHFPSDCMFGTHLAGILWDTFGKDKSKDITMRVSSQSDIVSSVLHRYLNEKL